MASERDLMLLDEYIANRLTEKERVEFEQRLASDPELKQEYSLQQKIAAGIRSARITELKTMLNNVSVASMQASRTNSLLKVAGFAIITALTVTGLYFYINRDGNQPKSEQSPRPETQDTASADRDNGSATAPSQQEDEPKASDTSTEKQPDNTSNETPATEQTEPVKEPVLNVFDPSEEITENKGAEQPSAELKNTEKKSEEPSIVVETDSNNKKYNFHYQFRDEKLFLYGPFEKNLYEIMEFFNDNKHTIFLFYNSNYYLLNDGHGKVRPLSPINDPALLKKLREFRN